jgi:hypothetical protein
LDRVVLFVDTDNGRLSLEDRAKLPEIVEIMPYDSFFPELEAVIPSLEGLALL